MSATELHAKENVNTMSQLFKHNKLSTANQLKMGENQSGVITLNEPPAVQQIALCSNNKKAKPKLSLSCAR